MRAGRLDIKGVPLPLPFLWAHRRHTAVACCISQGLCAEASVPGSSSALLFEDNQASEPRGLASCLVSWSQQTHLASSSWWPETI